MQIKIFTLPLFCDPGLGDELNLFLRAHKIIDVKKEFTAIEGIGYWTFCVSYMQEAQNVVQARAAGTTRIDYKEVLDEVTFNTFSIMRKIRKTIADEDAVPAYAVFTDAELAELAKLSELTPATMSRVPGIGKKKLEKYGERFMEKIKEKADETNRVSDREDS